MKFIVYLVVFQLIATYIVLGVRMALLYSWLLKNEYSLKKAGKSNYMKVMKISLKVAVPFYGLYLLAGLLLVARDVIVKLWLDEGILTKKNEINTVIEEITNSEKEIVIFVEFDEETPVVEVWNSKKREQLAKLTLRKLSSERFRVVDCQLSSPTK